VTDSEVKRYSRSGMARPFRVLRPSVLDGGRRCLSSDEKTLAGVRTRVS